MKSQNSEMNYSLKEARKNALPPQVDFLSTPVVGATVASFYGKKLISIDLNIILRLLLIRSSVFVWIS